MGGGDFFLEEDRKIERQFVRDDANREILRILGWKGIGGQDSID